MKDYFEQLDRRILKFRTKYAKRPKKAAFKMAVWNFKKIFSAQVRPAQNLVCPEKTRNSWIQLYEGLNMPYTSQTIQWFEDETKLPIFPYGIEIEFDLDNILKKNKQIKRLGFVFFMGIGDYLYATPFLKMLHQKYPAFKFDAYVSKNTDCANSPLVFDCLKCNPLFENIYTYSGKPRESNWKCYDYDECYQIKSDDTLLVPLVYYMDASIYSRTEGLCKTFKIPTPSKLLPPIIYPQEASLKVQKAFQKIKATKRKIIYFQTEARSSQFIYQDKEKLAEKLLQEGFFLITPNQLSIANKNLLNLKDEKFSIVESMALLKLLKENKQCVYCIGVASCCCPICSALKIPMLVLQQFYDPCIRSVYFSNLFIITHQNYPMICGDRQFIAKTENFQENAQRRIVYDSNFVLECFHSMLEEL